MNGIVIDEPGDSSRMQFQTNIPTPSPAQGQVIVRNEFVGVNYMDTHFRAGRYKATYPLVLGGEAAGTVAAVHSSVAERYKPGDRVAYICTNGAYAQYTKVPATQLMRIPDGISTSVAASVIAQGLTALTLAREAHEVKPGQWVLVHGASGGAGSLLVQICKTFGARVIATASTAAKAEVTRRNGAEVAIVTGTEDWVARVKEVTEGHGVDAVFDPVGLATFEGNLEAAARKATLVCFGNASGPVPPVDIVRLGGTKNLKLCRPTVFAYLATDEERESYARELFDLVQAVKVKAEIHKTYQLKDVVEAHDELEGRRSTGKILLSV